MQDEAHWVGWWGWWQGGSKRWLGGWLGVGQRCSHGGRRSRERLIQEMEASLRAKDHARFSELDLRFHFTIAHASKNKVLERILEDIRGLLSQLLQETAQYIPGTQDPSQRYHRQILKALRNQDRELAEKAIRSHIASFARAIGQYQRMKST